MISRPGNVFENMYWDMGCEIWLKSLHGRAARRFEVEGYMEVNLRT